MDDQCDATQPAYTRDHTCWCEEDTGHLDTRHRCGTCGDKWINPAAYTEQARQERATKEHDT